MPRRFTFLLLALLLMLRGWVGDAMAMGLPPAADAPQATVAVMAHEADGGAVQASHCQDAPDTSGCGGQAHAGEACAACGMCHPAPCAPVALPTSATLPAAGPDGERSARFASAPAQRAIRPPIA